MELPTSVVAIYRHDGWTRESVLVHEAGHAVAAYLLDWPIQSMMVRRVYERDVASYVQLAPKRGATAQERTAIAEAHLTIGMAGAVAETLVLGKLWVPGIEGDLALMFKYLRRRVTLIAMIDVIHRIIAGAQGRTTFEQAYRRAWELLQPQVGTITMLAAALEDEEEVAGSRVNELLA